MSRLTSRCSEDEFRQILGAVIFVVALIALAIAATITHIVVCIKTSAWALLLIGLLFDPIAVAHGVGCWFGWF